MSWKRISDRPMCLGFLWLHLVKFSLCECCVQRWYGWLRWIIVLHTLIWGCIWEREKCINGNELFILRIVSPVVHSLNLCDVVVSGNMRSLHSWVKTLRPMSLVLLKQWYSWCIRRKCSTSDPLHTAFPLLYFFYHQNSCLCRDFYSTVLVDAVMVKSYVHGILLPALVTIVIKIKKILRCSRANRISCQSSSVYIN